MHPETFGPRCIVQVIHIQGLGTSTILLVSVKTANSYRYTVTLLLTVGVRAWSVLHLIGEVRFVAWQLLLY